MNNVLYRLAQLCIAVTAFSQPAAARELGTEFVYGPSGGYNDAHVVHLGGGRWIDVDVDGSGPIHEWIEQPGPVDGEIIFDSARVPGRQLKLTSNEYWLKEPADSGFVRKYFGRWIR